VIDLLAVIVARLDADKIIAWNPLFAFGSESGLHDFSHHEREITLGRDCHTQINRNKSYDCCNF